MTNWNVSMTLEVFAKRYVRLLNPMETNILLFICCKRQESWRYMLNTYDRSPQQETSQVALSLTCSEKSFRVLYKPTELSLIHDVSKGDLNWNIVPVWQWKSCFAMSRSFSQVYERHPLQLVTQNVPLYSVNLLIACFSALPNRDIALTALTELPGRRQNGAEMLLLLLRMCLLSPSNNRKERKMSFLP
jgi:hypothetical protein